jgi:hypothetical protein
MLMLDDLQSKQLAGLEFDAKQFVVASEALERMLGGDPDQPAAAETDEQRKQRWADETFAGAHEELNALLGRRAEALERRRAAEIAEAEHRASEIHNHVAVAAAPAAHNHVAVAAELMPEGSEPPKQPRVSFVEHEPSPLRNASMNNVKSTPLPRKSTEVSPTYAAFAAHCARGSKPPGSVL